MGRCKPTARPLPILPITSRSLPKSPRWRIWSASRVEGELGHLGSLETGKGEVEDGHGYEGSFDRASLVTDPEEAAEFVWLTRVDALAVAIGTSAWRL